MNVLFHYLSFVCYCQTAIDIIKQSCGRLLKIIENALSALSVQLLYKTVRLSKETDCYAEVQYFTTSHYLVKY